jgi:hypothetical protein
MRFSISGVTRDSVSFRAPKYLFRAISNFYKNAQLCFYHRCVDTGDKLGTGVNDIAGVIVSGDKLMSVNSNPMVSQQNTKKRPGSKFFLFIAGVIDTGEQPLLMNICANFRKKRNCLNGILENLLSDSL